MKASHLTIRLSAALERALERLARRRGVPKSEVVREAVTTYVSGKVDPSPLSVVTGAELARRWASLPHLRANEAASIAKDIDAGRAELPELAANWE